MNPNPARLSNSAHVYTPGSSGTCVSTKQWLTSKNSSCQTWATSLSLDVREHVWELITWRTRSQPDWWILLNKRATAFTSFSSEFKTFTLKLNKQSIFLPGLISPHLHVLMNVTHGDSMVENKEHDSQKWETKYCRPQFYSALICLRIVFNST